MRLIRLTEEHVIKPFDCGDEDLNDFLINSAKYYSTQLLAVTNILENDSDTIAFFNLLNDKVTIEQVSGPREWNRFRKKFPNAKRISSYPAMKIGRFGVSNQFKGNGIGRDLIGYLKKLFVSNNRTGCRFITVDAYCQSLKFYEKCGFKYLTKNDENEDTRLMYFDLISMINSDYL
jgi:predicted GNAT family N-acyltransferase